MLVVVWLVFAAKAMLDARREAQAGLDRLDAARSQLTSRDLLSGRGEVALGEANVHFAKAYDTASAWWIAPLKIVPLLGEQIGSVESLSGGAADITRIGSSSLHAVRNEIDKVQRPRGAQRVALVRHLGQIATTTHAQLTPIGLGPDHWLVTPLQRAHTKFNDKLTELRTTVTSLVDASAGMADFLQGPRRYLVVAANNSEMRAGSGAFLSLGELVMRNGHFDLGTMRPSAILQPKSGAVHAGAYDADFAARFGYLDPTADFRELTESARFDVVAPLAVDMWKSHSGHSVDGVLVLDPVALQGLLKATGPVKVDGTVYSADNLLDQVFVAQYRGFDVNAGSVQQIERRDKLSKIARAAIQQIEHGNWKTVDLFEALRGAGIGRHILGWSSRSVEERGWLGAGVGGTFKSDSMLFSIQNRAGNKLDQFLTADGSISHATNRGGGTDIVVTSNVTNAIPQPIGQFPPYVLGPYVSNSTGAAGKYQGLFSAELPRLAQNIEIWMNGHAVPPNVIGRDGPDHQVIGANLTLTPGQSIAVEVRFSLPRGSHSLVVMPSARVLHPLFGRPGWLWHADGVQWADDRSRRVSL